MVYPSDDWYYVIRGEGGDSRDVRVTLESGEVMEGCAVGERLCRNVCVRSRGEMVEVLRRH